MAAARQRIIDLSHLVEEQIELEKQRDDLTRKVTQYDGLVKEGKRLVAQQTAISSSRKPSNDASRRLSHCRPLAALLQERVEALAQLRARLNERSIVQRQLQEKREQLQKKQEERETFATRLRKAEKHHC